MANPVFWPRESLDAARADAAQQSLSEKLAAFGRQYAQQQQQPQPVQQPALPSLTLDRNAFMPWLEDTAKTAVNTVSQGVQQATSALPSLDDVSAWMPWREKPQPAPSRADTTPSATGVAQTRPAAFGGTPQPMPQVSAQGQGEPLGTIAEGDPEQFFATAGPYARRVERDTGIPAALILAVAANETGYGQKRYMAGANNYFGIQAQPGEAGAVPYKDWRPGPGGGQVFYDAAQRSFADPLAGFYGFASFLKDNPRYAQALQQYQQTGNVEQLARDVHAAGYAEDPQWSNKLISIMRGIPTATGVGEVTDTRGVGLARPQPASGTPQAMPSASGDDLTPDQAALDDPDKWSLCGPVAAVAMARARGGNWTVAQAKAYAQQNGLWNAKQGMGGLQAEAKLLNGMGVAASARGVDWNAITQDVRGGNPVTLSTTFIDGGHYVVLEAYDPATGKFKVGGLGNVLKKTTGRGQWYTIGELNDLGGIQGALHFDNPASPTPSVAATAPTAGVPSAPADSPPTAPATPSPTQAGVAGVAPDINGAPGGTHAMLASGAAGEDQPPPPPQVYTRDQLQPDPAMAGVNGRTLIQGVAPDLAQGTGQQRAMAFPEQTPPTSSYNDPTDGGTQTQPLPVPVQPSYNDPTAGGTQSQPLPVPQPQLASGAAGEDTPSVPIPQATVADPTIQNPAYTQSSGTYYDPNDPTTWVNPDELGTLRPTDLPPALQGARPWNPPVAPPQGPIRVAPHVLDQIVPRAQQTAARPVESQPSELNPNSGTPQTAPYAPPTPEQQQIVATHIPQPGPPRIAPRTPNAHGDVEDSQPYPSDQQILQQQGPAAQAIDTLDRTLRSPEVQQAAATLAQLPTAPGNPITPIASLVRDYGRGSAQPLVAPSEDDRRAFMTGHQGTPSGLLDWHERMTVGAADALARGLGQDPARVVVGVRIGGVPVQMTVSDLLQNVTDPAFGAGFSVGDMVLDAVGQKALHLAAPYIKGAARGVVNALMQAAPPLQQGASAVGRGARALGEEAAGRLLEMTPQPSVMPRGSGGRPLQTVEVLQEKLAQARQWLQEARASGNAADVELYDNAVARLQSDLIDAQNARTSLEPRIRSDMGRRIEDVPGAQTTDTLGPERVSPQDARDLTAPSAVETGMGGRQNALIPGFDPASAALGAGAGAETDENGDPTVDPWRAGGGMMVAGILSNRFPGAARALQASQRRAANIAAKGLQRPSAWDWLKQAGYAGIYGPTTFVSSVLGGAGELVGAQAKESVRALVQGRASAYGAQLTAQARAIPEGLAGLGRVLWGGGADAAAARSGGSQGTAGLSDRVVNPIGHFVARVLERPGEILTEAPDAIFRPLFIAQGMVREAHTMAAEAGLRGRQAAAYADQLMQDARALRADPNTAVASEAARRVVQAGEAHADTLGYKGPASGFGKWLGAQAKRDDAVGVAASFLAPFPAMAERMTRAAARSTPGIGLLPGIRRGQPSRFDVVYDQALGTAIAGGVAYWAFNGGITGSGPSDPEKRKMMIDQGWQPNSTLVAGHYIPNRVFGRFQPMLDAAGELHDGLAYAKPDYKPSDLVADLVKRGTNIATDQVGLSGMADFHDLLTHGFASQAPGFVARSATRYFPYGGIIRAAANATDPQQRRPDKWDEGAWVPTNAIGQNVETAVPGLRQNVPAAQNSLGQDAPNPQYGLGALAPRMTTPRNDPTIRLFQDAGVDIGAPPSSVSYTPKGGRGKGVETAPVDLTPAEQRAWNRYRGEELVKEAQRTVQSAYWQRASQEDKQAELKAILTAVNKAASERVIDEMGRDYDRRLDAAIQQKKAS